MQRNLHNAIQEGGSLSLFHWLSQNVNCESLLEELKQINFNTIFDVIITSYSDNKITLTGKSDLFRYIKIPIEVSIWTNSADQLEHFALRYSLHCGSAETWKFDSIFSDLPEHYSAFTFSHDEDAIDCKIDDNVLLELSFESADILVTSDAIKGHELLDDEERNIVDICSGINFLGKAFKHEEFGVISQSILNAITGSPRHHFVFGRIYLPKVSAQYEAIQWPERPWPSANPIPGVHLKMPLLEGNRIDLGESVHIQNLDFHLYSPHSMDWISARDEKNRSYLPSKGFEVDLYFGPLSDNEKPPRLTLNSALIDDFGLIILDGEFENVLIGDLSALVNLTGSQSPEELIPEPFESKLSNANLKLERMSLCFAESNSSIPSVEYASITVGMGDVDNLLYDGLIKLEHLGLELFVTTPFTDPGLGLVGSAVFKLPLSGDKFASIGIEAGFEDIAAGQWFLSGELLEPVVIDLGDIVNHFMPDHNNQLIPGVTVDSKISLDTLKVAGGHDGVLQVDVEIARSTPWGFHVLGKYVYFKNVFASVIVSERDKSRSLRFGGELHLGEKFKVAAQFALSDELLIQAEFNEINFRSVLIEMGVRENSLPAGFDFQLNDGALVFREKDDEFSISLAAVVKGFGLVFIEFEKSSKGPGVEFGLSLRDRDPGELSSGLSEVQQFISTFGLTSLSIYFTNLNKPTANFGKFIGFTKYALNVNESFSAPGQSKFLSKQRAGLWLYANLSMAPTDHGISKLLDYMNLDVSEGDMQIGLHVGTNPATDTSLYVELDNVVVGNPKAGSIDGYLGIGISNGVFELDFGAIYKTTIHDIPCEFGLKAEVFPTGILVEGDYVSAKPIIIDHIELRNIGLVLGIDDIGLPSLGFTAEITSGNFDASVALFLDSIEPQKSMFAGSVNSLNLLQAICYISNISSNDIPAFLRSLLDSISIEGRVLGDVDISLAQALKQRNIKDVVDALNQVQDMSIPHDSKYSDSLIEVIQVVESENRDHWFITDLSSMMHYSLSALFDKGCIEVATEAQVRCVPQDTHIGPGILFPKRFFLSGRISILGETLDIVMDIEPNLGVSIDAKLEKPIVLINESIFHVFNPANRNTGPEVFLRTFDNPNEEDEKKRSAGFCLQAGVNVAGLEEDINIDLNDNGLSFKIHDSKLDTLSYSLEGNYRHEKKEFDLHGEFKFEVGNRVVKALDLNWENVFEVDGDLNMTGDSKALTASFLGHYSLFNSTHAVELENINIQAHNLTHIPSLAWEEISDQLQVHLSNALNFLEAIEQGFIHLSLEVENNLITVVYILKDVCKSSMDEITRLLREIADGNVLFRIFLDAFDATIEEINSVLHFVANELEEFGDILISLFGADDAIKFMKEHYAELSDPVKFVSTFFRHLETLKLARMMISLFPGLAVPVLIAALASKLGQEDIVDIVKELFSDLSKESLASIFMMAAFPPSAIALVLQDTFGFIGDDIVKALSSIGIESEIITKALTDAGFQKDAVLVMITVAFPPAGLVAWGLDAIHKAINWP